MSNIFANKTAAKGDKVETDYLGGGGALDTDIYTGTIKYAYMSQSGSSDAQAVNISVMVGKTEVTQQFWVINKQGEVTYKDKKTGDLKNLPAYNQINGLAMLVAGKEIGELDVEEKTLSLYDFDAKKELPKSVDCFVELHGVEVQVAVQRQTVDKTKKNETTGNYDPTGETRDQNEFVKFFRGDSLASLSEIANFVEGLGGDFDEVLADGQLEEAISNMPEEKISYAVKWLEKNRGQTYDKSAGASGAKKEGKAFGGSAASGGSGGGEAKKKSSLFD